MDIYEATMVAEGAFEARDEAHFLEAWQLLVDTGICWTLQGWFGRTARDMINSGQIKEKIYEAA